MENEVATIKAAVALVPAVVTLIGLVGAACLFIGGLSPRISYIARREREFYMTTIEKLGTLEKKVGRLQGRMLGIQRQFMDLLVFQIKKLL